MSRRPAPSTQSIAGETNDTVAVALEGSVGAVRRPKITASGQGDFADQILEIARAAGVPIREDQDLASLLAALDVDSEIPLEALAAVARLLTEAHRINEDLKELAE